MAGRPRKEATPEPSSYEKLIAKEANTQPEPKVERANPVVTRIVAKPMVNVTAPSMGVNHEMAWLIDKTGALAPFYCVRSQAIKQAQKYPQRYEVR